MMVKLAELLDAFEILNAGNPFDDQAYVSLETGAICIVSKTIGIREGPEDIAQSDKYLAVPSRIDLELGRKLVLSFVDQETPDQGEVVYDMFRRKGAYASSSSGLWSTASSTPGTRLKRVRRNRPYATGVRRMGWR